MDSSTKRQLKDIQYRAENLINGRPSMNDIEEFDQYNEELKSFLLKNLTDKELLDRVTQIPKILDETQTQVATGNILVTVLSTFTSGIATYFRNRQKIENAMSNIHEAKGKYSSIEFLSKNLE